MWIKLCGMTRLQDAIKAQELGADAIGFIFAPSPRQITAEQAAEIAEQITIPKVGVFVDMEMKELQKTLQTCLLDYVQLHGNESPAYCADIDVPVIKAFRVRDRSTLQKLKEYPDVWKILLDAWVPGQHGGTGVRLDLDLLSTMDPVSYILAGGITPNNVSDILATIRPFGLDVSSGIEDAPGIKNHDKMKSLIQTIKETSTYA